MARNRGPCVGSVLGAQTIDQPRVRCVKLGIVVRQQYNLFAVDLRKILRVIEEMQQLPAEQLDIPGSLLFRCQ